jgi:hypothetical protein
MTTEVDISRSEPYHRDILGAVLKGHRSSVTVTSCGSQNAIQFVEEEIEGTGTKQHSQKLERYEWNR